MWAEATHLQLEDEASGAESNRLGPHGSRVHQPSMLPTQ